MPTDCFYYLKKSDPVYYAGDTVEGKIDIVTSSIKVVKEITIRLIGEGKVKWEEPVELSNSNFSRQYITFTAYESIFEERINARNRCVLPTGLYSFNFKFTLSPEVLTSCESRFGHIYYEISLVIKRPNGYDNIFKKPVTVIKPFDLNIDPIFKEPPPESKSKYEECSCCLSLTKSKCYFTLKTQFHAYAPGQRMKYTLRVKNKSRAILQDCYLRFMKKVTYTAQLPSIKTMVFKIELASKLFPGICLSDDVIEDAFVIPPTPPTTTGTNMISIEYYLRARAEFSSCVQSTMATTIPIVIGTVPVRESLLPNQFIEIEAEEGARSLLMIPPIFQQDFPFNNVFVDTDVEVVNRPKRFRPLYPVYKTDSS